MPLGASFHLLKRPPGGLSQPFASGKVRQLPSSRPLPARFGDRARFTFLDRAVVEEELRRWWEAQPDSGG